MNLKRPSFFILAIFLILIFITGGFASAQVGDEPPETVSPAQVGAPDTLDADWWSTVQDGIQQAEYQITWQEQTYLPDISAAYQAPNRAENLRTYFLPDRLIVIPRTGIETDEPLPWRWEARLQAWGRAGTLLALPQASLDIQENHISYLRQARLSEVYLNDEEGLQQIFTVAEPPTASPSGGVLLLELALGGDLTGGVSEGGRQVVFSSPTNTNKINRIPTLQWNFNL